jgi:hypothetical protein
MTAKKERAKKKNKKERTKIPKTNKNSKRHHTCNPSFSGGKDRGIVVGSQPGKIVCETLS